MFFDDRTIHEAERDTAPALPEYEELIDEEQILAAIAALDMTADELLQQDITLAT